MLYFRNTGLNSRKEGLIFVAAIGVIPHASPFGRRQAQERLLPKRFSSHLPLVKSNENRLVVFILQFTSFPGVVASRFYPFHLLYT